MAALRAGVTVNVGAARGTASAIFEVPMEAPSESRTVIHRPTSVDASKAPLPVVSTAVKVASVFPAQVTVGAEVYPEPAFVIVIPVMTPATPPTVAVVQVPAAPLPPPSVKLAVPPSVYPVPPPPMVTEATPFKSPRGYGLESPMLRTVVEVCDDTLPESQAVVCAESSIARLATTVSASESDT